MPDDNTTLTPQAGTDSALTPGAGTDSSQTAAAVTEPDHPSTEPDYRTKFAESTREAQRLFAENQRLVGMLQGQQAIYQQQQSQPHQQPAPAPRGGANYGFEDTLADLQEGFLDRKPEKIEPFANAIVRRAKQELLADLSQEAGKASRTQASQTYISSNLKDNQALTQQAISRYGQLLSDPTYTGMVEDVRVNIGGTQINPHLMRLAIMEVKAAQNVANQSVIASGVNNMDNFVEPSKPAPARKEGFNPSKHLFDWERDYCQKRNTPYDHYWKFMDSDIKAKRLELGKPVRRVKNVYIA
jgi:hypothetical protein